MFNNIGQKIKTLAKVLCWIGIVFSVITGLASMALNPVAGILVAALGVLVSWIGSFLSYGFGELIDRIISIDETLNEQKKLVD